MYGCSVYMCVCTLGVYSTTEARKEYQVSQDWTYRQLCATMMWVLEIKPESSGTATSDLNCWVISSPKEHFNALYHLGLKSIQDFTPLTSCPQPTTVSYGLCKSPCLRFCTLIGRYTKKFHIPLTNIKTMPDTF